MPAPYPWMARWQETSDDPILYVPRWNGGADDAVPASAPLLPPGEENETARSEEYEG